MRVVGFTHIGKYCKMNKDNANSGMRCFQCPEAFYLKLLAEASQVNVVVSQPSSVISEAEDK